MRPRCPTPECGPPPPPHRPKCMVAGASLDLPICIQPHCRCMDAAIHIGHAQTCGPGKERRRLRRTPTKRRNGGQSIMHWTGQPIGCTHVRHTFEDHAAHHPGRTREAGGNDKARRERVQEAQQQVLRALRSQSPCAKQAPELMVRNSPHGVETHAAGTSLSPACSNRKAHPTGRPNK